MAWNRGFRRSKYSKYLTTCEKCGKTTTKHHAREHGGVCKACKTGAPVVSQAAQNMENAAAAHERESAHDSERESEARRERAMEMYFERDCDY